MKYDFDVIHDRRGTNSMKHDGHRRFGKREGLLPLWVADMDFKVPYETEEALVRCARHGIFGYSEPSESYFEAVRGWFTAGFGYSPEPEWTVTAPGVVFAVAAAIRAFSAEGDAVMIQRPVYHPFSTVIEDNRRRLVVNRLRYEGGKYSVDFEDFEKKIVENNVKIFILCSPHNPAGRVWARGELERVGDICLKHNCLVLSDEIHCDFVYAPHKHIIFSTIKPEFADNSIVLTAPSKTFNIPGLQISNNFVKSPIIRRKLIAELQRTGYSQMNTMGLVACENSYRYGRDWLNQLLDYLVGNMKLVYEFGERTGMKPVSLEGTYLAWIDFSPLGVGEDEVDRLITEKAGLWISPGSIFGAEKSESFERINIACPRAVLAEALGRIEGVL